MKRSRRHQKGYVFRKGNSWYLRYYDYEIQTDGTIKLVSKCRKLVTYGGDYRSKKAAQVLADEFLAPINNGTLTPHSTMKLAQFVDSIYLPFVKAHKRPSTYRGYLNMWTRYLEPRSALALRDFRTVDGERLLEDIANEHALTCTTMAHIKAFLSGAFRYAKRQGVMNSENPMRDVVLPKAKPAGDTFAYSLEEIRQMLNVLTEPAVTVVATAAFTGVREGELRGLLWEDYDGEQIRITQSVWRKHIQEPKTKKSAASVPIIPRLAERLELHRALMGNPTSGLVFPNSVGKPMCMARLARDIIRPAFLKAGLQWHGWHAFRRGLATNLHRLGVPDKTIQAILRHSNVAVTQACYIKTSNADAVEAMLTLEHATNVQLEQAESKISQQPPVM
jgi:integrase